MFTKKKQAVAELGCAAVFSLWLLAGCTPSGPDALLDGKRMLDRGQTGAAIRLLRDAVTLMPTNALAWSYLGLAYQQSGSASNAVVAYRQALAVGPESAVIRFNLGCVWMEQGQWAAAREQFAAATVLDRKSDAAWRWLGEAQVRLGDSAQAVRSLGESLRLRPESAEAWNWLGVAQLQQGRLPEAERSFQSALRIQANHGPSMLNLAILNQQQLKNPRKALELYRQYLAFLPDAGNVAEVRAVADHLEESLKPAPKPIVATAAPVRVPEPAPEPQPPKTDSNVAAVVVQTNVVTRPVVVPQPVVTNRPVVVRTEPVRQPEPERVAVAAPPPIARTVRTPEPAPTPPAAVDVQPPEDEPGPVPQSAGTEAPKKRGFFAKINPLNLWNPLDLFRKGEREKEPTPLPEGSDRTVEVAAGASEIEPVTRTPMVFPSRVEVSNGANFSRFSYRSTSLAKGDRETADRLFEQAEVYRRRGRTSEALQGYLLVVKADPSHFAGQFNLGLLALESGDLPRALAAFEAATSLKPDSVPARYNFALALKSANYPVDSANELLTLLSDDPDDPGAHLTLGNLYAQQFGDKANARLHYTRVLELAPGHPQAASIRFWLVENPR